MFSFRKQLEALTKSGLLRGSLSAAEQLKLISGTNNLEEACKDTVHIQECVPENPELKKKVFASVAGFVNSDETVICSSTSCLMPSKIFSGKRSSPKWTVRHVLNWNVQRA